MYSPCKCKFKSSRHFVYRSGNGNIMTVAMTLEKILENFVKTSMNAPSPMYTNIL